MKAQSKDLSKRERDVVKLLLQGKSNKQIAVTPGIAETTVEFLLIFGVWLIPTVYPARYEFRYSDAVGRSVSAVIMMWVSAVVGYYLIYTVLLAFVGLPNMEYYLVFGKHDLAFWQHCFRS